MTDLNNKRDALSADAQVKQVNNDYANKITGFLGALQEFSIESQKGSLDEETVLKTYYVINDAYESKIIEREQFQEEVENLTENKTVAADPDLKRIAAKINYDVVRKLFDEDLPVRFARNSTVTMKDLQQFEDSFNMMLDQETLSRNNIIDEKHKKHALLILDNVRISDGAIAEKRDSIVEGFQKLIDPDNEKQRFASNKKAIESREENRKKDAKAKEEMAEQSPHLKLHINKTDVTVDKNSKFEEGGAPEVQILDKDAHAYEVVRYIAAVETLHKLKALEDIAAYNCIRSLKKTIFSNEEARSAKHDVLKKNAEFVHALSMECDKDYQVAYSKGLKKLSNG